MDLEPRLIKRYQQLVRSHMLTSDFLSSGIKSALSKHDAFNQTQAAWRFFNNEPCSLDKLVKPILNSALEQASQQCINHTLIAHDWSGLIYKSHTSKDDRFGVHHEQELGYELQASLLLNDQHGGPIAPVAMNVVTKTTVLSTYRKDGTRDETHLEELAKRVNYLESFGFQKPLIHIVDRESDSVQLMRAMGNYKWLFRSRSNSRVEYESVSLRVDTLATQLTYTMAREINYKGRKAVQYLAEAGVSITRISQPKKRVDEKKQRIKGEPVPARFMVSRVEDEQGNILAWWYLLTNVDDVAVDEMALWYYWRWSIESFFKLLKSAGMHLESWQQETGEAVARRLLIACMACVFVWQIAEAKGPEAGELRKILVKLSGRQMKYGVSFTRPALYAGLCSLLTTMDLLEQYNVDELKHMLQEVMGNILL